MKHFVFYYSGCSIASKNPLILKINFKVLLHYVNFVCLLHVTLVPGSFAEEDIGRQGISVPSIVGNATASRGLEAAVANLQEYCNGMAASWHTF